jgi:hypothetical protein
MFVHRLQTLLAHMNSQLELTHSGIQAAESEVCLLIYPNFEMITIIMFLTCVFPQFLDLRRRVVERRSNDRHEPTGSQGRAGILSVAIQLLDE